NFGNKLKKVVTDSTADPVKETTWLYIENLVYKDDWLQFFTHEEGRARYDTSQTTGEATLFEYDYFLRDHLGNVRMVLSAQRDTVFYPSATIEEDNRANEVVYYDIKTAQV